MIYFDWPISYKSIQILLFFNYSATQMIMQFFRGNAKKEEKKPQQQSTPQTLPGGMTLEQAQQQQTLVTLSEQLAESKDRIDTMYTKIEKQETKIKDLISRGKRTEAKRQLMTFKMIQDELVKSENLVTTLEKAKVQLEASLEINSMIGVLRTANEIQKQLDANRDEIENVLMDRKDLEQDQKDLSNLISELANGTEEEREEINELYEKYEHEVLGEQIMNINAKPVDVNVNANIQRVTQPVQQRQQQQVEDSINDILQQSLQYC